MTHNAPHKLSNIQALRGLAALLVMFSHLPSIEIKHATDSILPNFFRLGINGVDLFFVISGFIMVYVTWQSPRSVSNSLKFLFARLTRIYPIYWAIFIALLTAWSFQPNILNFDPEQTSFLKSFFLWPEQTLPMLKVAWTLIHELYFYLIFALILCLPRRFLCPALGLWAGIVVIGNLSGAGKFSPETALIFHPLTIEFFMGAIAGFIFMQNSQRAKTRLKQGQFYLAIGSAAFIAATAYLALTLDAKLYPTNWARTFYFGLPAAFIIYGLAHIEHGGMKLPRWAATFGDWSYSLYLSHLLTLSALGFLWRPLARQGPLDNIIALIILPIAAIIISAIIWYGLERPMLRFFKARRDTLFP